MMSIRERFIRCGFAVSLATSHCSSDVFAHADGTRVYRNLRHDGTFVWSVKRPGAKLADVVSQRQVIAALDRRIAVLDELVDALKERIHIGKTNRFSSEWAEANERVWALAAHIPDEVCAIADRIAEGSA